jgi:hypothetical protein
MYTVDPDSANAYRFLAVLIIAAEIGKAVLLAETTAPRGDAKVAA